LAAVPAVEPELDDEPDADDEPDVDELDVDELVAPDEDDELSDVDDDGVEAGSFFGFALPPLPPPLRESVR
jgi:hypothetical protein